MFEPPSLIKRMANELSNHATNGHNLLENKSTGYKEDRTGSPGRTSDSPRLSRKAITDLGDTEKTGVPLNTPWTLWLDRSVPNLTVTEYEANLRKIYTVSTVESFWGVFNHVPAPSNLMARYSYHWMRNNIRPVWEDSVNANGGMWKLRCHKLCTDSVWNELLMACIGEQFAQYVNPGDDIIGLSVSVRKNDDLVQLWNRESINAEECKVLKRVEELVPNVTFETSFYKPHQKHRAFEGKRGHP
uniref:Eukaryotic translation initiation factor 4E type 3 n=1 Tax=Phallusia mammillata TaxID=59560 RepID=A0A6F9DCG3_9ASCI|nr:eukaryotic translation initiation factor 4E type 3 [Phallusia mammillata]